MGECSIAGNIEIMLLSERDYQISSKLKDKDSLLVESIYFLLVFIFIIRCLDFFCVLGIILCQNPVCK